MKGRSLVARLATGERRQAQTGTSGDYQVLNLVPGTHCLEVEQKGFIPGSTVPISRCNSAA